jgi:D-3-phosphoglycerate dehydrogenase
VLEKQPPDPDEPLLRLDNVIITPHDAAITKETGKTASMLLVQGLIELFNGKLPSRPINIVDLRVAREYVGKRVGKL